MDVYSGLSINCSALWFFPATNYYELNFIKNYAVLPMHDAKLLESPFQRYWSCTVYFNPEIKRELT